MRRFRLIAVCAVLAAGSRIMPAADKGNAAKGKEVFEQIRRVFGPKLFETVITKSVRLEESPAYKESIFTFAPQSSGAVEYEKLCNEVMSRV